MLNTTKDEYKIMTDKASPPSPKIKDFLSSFAVGGFICVIGQLIFEWLSTMGIEEKSGRSAVSIILILLAAVLTAVGVFDDIASFAKAGTLVPITGFANAMVSPAIEFKREGAVPGIGAKLFSIAGPVIVFGITASAIYGFFILLFRLL